MLITASVCEEIEVCISPFSYLLCCLINVLFFNLALQQLFLVPIEHLFLQQSECVSVGFAVHMHLSVAVNPRVVSCFALFMA